MSAVLIYVTCSSMEEAEQLGAELIKRRLAACTNILGSITSMFHWKGQVENDREVALLAKTRQDLVADLTAAVLELHSYETPCVVALPIIGGNPDFLKWVEAETGPPSAPRIET
ncbi:MAG: divalent-cation tolerance protein CutA [Desulfovibrionaceae bacterium]